MFEKKDYHQAFSLFKKAYILDKENKKLNQWMRKCKVEMDDNKDISSDDINDHYDDDEGGQKKGNENSTTLNPCFPSLNNFSSTDKKHLRYEWFQTSDQVIIEIYIKNIKNEQVDINLNEYNIDINININYYNNYNLNIDLAHSIDKTKSSYNILPTKIEIKLRKLKISKWKTLEKIYNDDNNINIESDWQTYVDKNKGNSIHYYPSSKGNKDWSKIGCEDTDSDEEKLNDEEQVNKTFESIFNNGTDEQRKAMLKSFYESAGTVLSTDWGEVGKKKIEVQHVEGVELRTWNDY